MKIVIQTQYVCISLNMFFCVFNGINIDIIAETCMKECKLYIYIYGPISVYFMPCKYKNETKRFPDVYQRRSSLLGVSAQHDQGLCCF